jgi:predicted  nucleic acid-binding Zn-ribbon protein
MPAEYTKNLLVLVSIIHSLTERDQLREEKRVAPFNANPIIEILVELADSTEFDVEQIDEAIDALESIKSTINADDDEAIDKVDEIQDYLQYLMTVKEPLLAEIKEELANLIKDLQK